MIDLFFPVILLVGIVTLFVAVATLRSSRRSEALGEHRHEILHRTEAANPIRGGS